MRKHIARLLVVFGVVAASTIALLSTSAGAVGPVGIADLTVSGSTRTPQVSIGDHAFTTWSVSNGNPLPVDNPLALPGTAQGGSLAITLPAGATYVDSLSTASCSATGTSVTCPVDTLSIGQIESFDVIYDTNGMTAGTKTSNAHVTANSSLSILEVDSNNDGSVSNELIAPTDGVIAGFFPPCSSFTLNASGGIYLNGQVPCASNGVVLEYAKLEPPTLHTCSEGLDDPDISCKPGVAYSFLHDGVHEINASDSFFMTFTERLGPIDPCNGLSPNLHCYKVFTGMVGQIALTQKPGCATAADRQCITGLSRIGGGPQIQVTSRQTTEDPVDVLATINKATGSNGGG